MRPLPLLFALALALTACGQPSATPADAERIPIAQGTARAHDPLPSPDTTSASWFVDANGRTLHFGNRNEKPFLSLDCLISDGPAQLAIIRHAAALPGQEALFPVYGNGVRSRFLADATLRNGEWRWEAVQRADDPQLDVFLGPRELIATLPGKGTLEIGKSRMPGQFVEWCRSGGRAGQPAGQPR